MTPTARIVCDVVTLVARRPVDDASLDLREDLGLDSLQILDAVTALEDSFGLVIGEEDFEGVRSIQALADRLDGRRG